MKISPETKFKKFLEERAKKEFAVRSGIKFLREKLDQLEGLLDRDKEGADYYLPAFDISNNWTPVLPQMVMSLMEINNDYNFWTKS